MNRISLNVVVLKGDNMLSNDEMIGLQAERHELVETNEFHTKEDYVLNLIHTKAYEQASLFANNKVVLDIGCNVGYGCNIISEFSNEVVGVDVSRNAISIAKSHYSKPRVKFKLVDGKSLPFKDSKFELILSFQVIEHIVDYKRYISEIKRVLSPNGLVIFTTPNANIRLEPGMKPWNPFHVHEFNSYGLNNLLSKFFAKVQVYGLFAEEELYSIEFNRLRRRLEYEKIQKKREQSGFQFFYSRIKTTVPDRLKILIKNYQQKQKKFSLKRENSLEIDKAFKKKYSTMNFYYRKNKIEKALDLLVICGDDASNIDGVSKLIEK